MNRVGLVGGLGPESTIDYYRRILNLWRAQDPTSFPQIVIDSLDVDIALKLVASDRVALTEYLAASLRRLRDAGVDFIAMTANTPHIVFDELAAQISIPMVSIVEVCAQEAQRRGLTRMALLGTRFTMQASFYPTVFARNGMTIIPPSEPDLTWVHDKYVGELLKGDFLDSTREQFVALIHRLRETENVDGVVLGGTELPLLLKSSVIAGIPVLDTTELHVSAIVSHLQ